MADGHEKNVECVASGDQVAVLKNGVRSQETVIWVGQRAVRANLNLPHDQSGLAICIRKDAFAEGQPYTDLYVSAEHCIFHAGQFVPARMLVIGGSIAYDPSKTRLTYHHIETRTHAVVSSNGLLTETYLDTGNRNAFSLNECNVHENRKRKNWSHVAAALLNTARAFVEPLHEALQSRSVQIGLPLQGRRVDSIPFIKVVCQDGESASLQHVRDGRNVFDLPQGALSVSIRSNIFGPVTQSVLSSMIGGSSFCLLGASLFHKVMVA